MLRDHLLNLLADGEFHSGQALADTLGVSRTAIWKQIRALLDLGVGVERVRGKGYRVAGGLELLDERRIRDAMRAESSGLLADFSVLRSTDSTNAELQRRQLAPDGATVCLAEMQTAGRGRRGRQWLSPFASNIYCSTAWRFSGGATAFEGLSLAVGVIVCRALRRLQVDALSLKWPNDVLRNARKLAGILVEMHGDVTGPCTAIVGIGINVKMPEETSALIDQPWSDLRASDGSFPSRNTLVSQLLDELLPALAAYETTGFAAWRDEWTALDAYAEQPVLIQNSSAVRSGIAAGVDAQGALCLRTEQGLDRIHGGEVSLRPAATT